MSYPQYNKQYKPLLGLALAAFITASFGFSADSLAKRPLCSQDNLKMRAKTKKQMVYHARQARRYGAPIKKSTVRLLGGVKVLPRCRNASPDCLRKAKSHLGHVKALQGLLQRLRRACITKEQIAHQRRRRRILRTLSRRMMLKLLGTKGASGTIYNTRGKGFKGGRLGVSRRGFGLVGSHGIGYAGTGLGRRGGRVGFGGGGRGGGFGVASIGKGRRTGPRVKLAIGWIPNPSLRQGVMRRMYSLRSFFRFCYRRVLRRRPGLKGRIRLSFTIGKTGRAMRLSMWGSASRSTSLQRCIKRKMRLSRFPKSPKKNTRVSCTLRFMPR